MELRRIRCDATKLDGEKQATFQFHEIGQLGGAPHGVQLRSDPGLYRHLDPRSDSSPVTSMGEEARNAKRDIPRAVLLSLFIQGVVCYLIEYFCAGFFLNPGYTATNAAASEPIGDMMVIVGTWLFGSPTAGWWFMFIQAITVFLALIGTTLSCINTGARVTYAMGRDDEVPSHFGMLHGKNLTPHRAIWTLAAVSAVVGIFAVLMYLCGPAATAALEYGPDGCPEERASGIRAFLVFSAAAAKSCPIVC